MCCTGSCPWEVRTGWNDTRCDKPPYEPCWLETDDEDDSGDCDLSGRIVNSDIWADERP